MSTEDPITPDGSTVYRGQEAPSVKPEEPGSTHTRPSVDEISDQIAEAKTVIRGVQPPATPRSQVRTPAAVAKVLQGEYLDHFLLEELIGGGGMGAVFRAHDGQLDRTVAIKVIPFVSDAADLQRRFKNEAQSAAKLDHPRIARVYGVGHQGDWHYIVFEFIRGINIRDFVANEGVMHVDDAVFYTTELASAIQHAADRGIVHRDIKPSNVLIAENNNIKLVDMGLARSENLDMSEDMTASGVTLGTFDYISPEQAADPRNADLRSDIYSLGCTLYFMLTGSPPYPGGTMLQKLISHSKSPPPDARSLRPEISPRLASIVQTMLAKEPADRYQSGIELVADLRDLAFDEGLTRSQGAREVTVRRRTRVYPWIRQTAPWAAAILVLAVTTLWLEFSSASSFELRPSVDAKQPELAPSNPDAGLPNASHGNQPDEEENALSTESQPFDSPVTPPSLVDLPIPGELAGGDFTAPPVTDSTTSEPPFFPAPLDPGDGTSPAFQPNTIRVLGPQEAADLLPDARQRYRDGVLQSRSLAEAVDEAAKFGVDRIEVTAPIVYSKPFKVQTDGLLISSTVPGGTIIQMESNYRSLGTAEQMVAIGSNRIEMDDLHFIWNVPRTAFNGGSLITLTANKLVRMTDCSITINNSAGEDGVYAFSVFPSDSDSTLTGARSPGSPKEELPLVALELNNMVVRGEISMIHLNYATELQLQWENGLLAVTGQLLRSRGANVNPQVMTAPIQLSLIRLTADAGQGLALMQLSGDTKFPILIDRQANNCVFLANPGMGHITYTGLTSDTNVEQIVALRGEGNVYDIQDESDPLLKTVSSDGVSNTTNVQDIRRSTPGWFLEKSTRWRAFWSAEHETKFSSHTRTVNNYTQYGSVISGFDADALPTLPTPQAPLNEGEDRPSRDENP